MIHFNPLAFELQMANICDTDETVSIHLQKKTKVTNPQSHDTVSMMQHVLTRSVGVICLSRYLQHLTVTGYKRLNNLIIYKLSSYTAIAKPAARDFANTAPYRLATVIRSLLTIRTSKRLAAPLTQTPSTAEPLAARHGYVSS